MFLTGLGNKGPLKVLNGTKLILDDHGNNLDSYSSNQYLTGQELFFAVSYSKPAIVKRQWFWDLETRKFVIKHSIYRGIFMLLLSQSLHLRNSWRPIKVEFNVLHHISQSQDPKSQWRLIRMIFKQGKLLVWNASI